MILIMVAAGPLFLWGGAAEPMIYLLRANCRLARRPLIAGSNGLPRGELQDVRESRQVDRSEADRWIGGMSEVEASCVPLGRCASPGRPATFATCSPDITLIRSEPSRADPGAAEPAEGARSGPTAPAALNRSP